MAKKNPIFDNTDLFSKKYLEMAETVKTLIRENIKSGLSAGRATKKALKDAGYDQKITQFILDGVQASVLDGGVKAVTDPVGFRDWWLNRHFNPAELSLAQKIASGTAQKLIGKTLQDQMEAGSSWVSTARAIKKQDLVNGDVAKHIRKVENIGRRVMQGDPTAIEKFHTAAQQSRRNIERLAKHDAPTRFLKKAYSKVVDAAEKQNPVSLDKAITRAVNAKARYNAERIARTEMARAYGEGFMTKAINDPQVIAFRSDLSSRHPKPDICFTEDTLIETANGSTQIKDVQVGMKVYTHENRLKKVLKVIKTKYTGDMVKVSFQDSSGEQKRVNSTPNHPFLIGSKWIPAGDVKKGSDGTALVAERSGILHQWICGVFCKVEEYFQKNVHQVDLKNTFLVLYDGFRNVLKNIECIYHHVLQFSNDAAFFDAYNNFLPYHPSNLGYSFPSGNQINVFGKLQNVETDLGVFYHSSDCQNHTGESIEQNNISAFYGSVCTCTHNSNRSFEQQHDISDNRQNHRISFQQILHTLIFGGSSYIVGRVLKFLKPYIQYSLKRKNMQCIKKLIYDFEGFVYNLEVEDDHTYTANSLVVHNCDFHAQVDLYGIGKGVYPLNTHPPYPYHPHCLCVLTKIFKTEGEQEPFSDKNAMRYLSGLSPEKKKALLGKAGAEAFDKDPSKWKANLKNYNGQKKRDLKGAPAKVPTAGKPPKEVSAGIPKKFVSPNADPLTPFREWKPAKTVEDAVAFTQDYIADVVTFRKTRMKKGMKLRTLNNLNSTYAKMRIDGIPSAKLNHLYIEGYSFKTINKRAYSGVFHGGEVTGSGHGGTYMAITVPAQDDVYAWSRKATRWKRNARRKAGNIVKKIEKLAGDDSYESTFIHEYYHNLHNKSWKTTGTPSTVRSVADMIDPNIAKKYPLSPNRWDNVRSNMEIYGEIKERIRENISDYAAYRYTTNVNRSFHLLELVSEAGTKWYLQGMKGTLGLGAEFDDYIARLTKGTF